MICPFVSAVVVKVGFVALDKTVTVTPVGVMPSKAATLTVGVPAEALAVKRPLADTDEQPVPVHDQVTKFVRSDPEPSGMLPKVVQTGVSDIWSVPLT